MPFNAKLTAAPEPTLVDVDDSKDPAVAIMSDGTNLEFPKGLKFVPDNHEDPGSGIVSSVRLRVVRHKKVGDKMVTLPPVWLPQHYPKHYVEAIIARLVKEAADG